MARSALVIGIARYSNFRNLEKTVNDAGAIAEILEQHGHYAIEPLPRKLVAGDENRYELDRDPKKEVKGNDLRTKLQTFLLEQAKGKDALIYFAGHGFVLPNLAKKNIGYFSATDTAKDGQNALSFGEFTELVAESELNNLVVLLDCCHAGNLIESSQYQAMQKVFNDKKNYYLMAACRGFERSREGVEHGIFTAAVLEVLRARVSAGEAVDLDVLFSEVSQRLKQSGQEVVRSAMGGAITLIEKARGNVSAVVDETCPYVGLNAFDESTAQWFFGRETAFKRLMSKIEQSPFVFVVGVSGSGKSSLVKSKLIPEMKRRGRRILLMKPWSNPIQKLKDVFAEILEETGTDVIEFEQRIDTDGLLAAIADLPKPILLVIDQFEEVFTVCSQVADRRKFIQMLVDVAQTQTADFVVVATMRIDFLAECTYANLDAIVNEQMVVISGMSEDELRDAIAKPAETQGYQLSDGLLDAILQDIEAEPNCLPLLEFALQELWENRNRQQRRLSLEGYRQMERLKGALNRHADWLYGQQSASGQEWMRRIFLKLVRTGKDAKDTRQRERRQVILDLAGDDGNARKEIERILKSLEGKSGRLLVASEENGVAIVDLAHEALMEGWQRFAVWRSQDRDLRRLSDRVEDGCKEWELKGKVEGYLLSNGLILEVREQWESIKPLLSIAAQDYFQSSEGYMLVREQLGGANQQLAVVVQELRNLAGLDDLTQLSNRRVFNEYLEQQWQKSAREKSPFSLIMCDIDCFKDYVDIYGHMAGDGCIRKVSRIIGESVNRPADLAANYRGEVFALVLPNTAKEEALQKAESIKRQVLELKIPHENSMFAKFVTLNVGVTSLVPLVTSSSLEILKSVDYALSLTKKSGKNQT